MLTKYKKQGNIAAGIWLVTLVVVLAIMPSVKGNVWDNPQPATIVVIISVASFWFTFWAYAKAKGYSGIIGLVLPLLSIFGLAILLALKDKHKEQENITS